MSKLLTFLQEIDFIGIFRFSYINMYFCFLVYPQVTQNPENVTITEGKQVKMECKFSGDPKPVITWEKDTKTLSSDTNIKITDSGNGSVLAINNTAGKNSGRYRCVATLKHISERTEEAMLFVRGKNFLIKFIIGEIVMVGI